MSKFLYILASCLATVMVFSACTPKASEQGDNSGALNEVNLSAVKDYTLENSENMKKSTDAMAQTANEYFKIIEANQFDYQQVWDNQALEIVSLIEKMKENWLDASYYYESEEGIIAGVPSLAEYDVWLDAGPSGEEDPVEAKDWALELADGRIIEKPGNFFHHLLEPSIWGTDPEFVAFRTQSETLPDAYIVLAASEGIDIATAEMIESVKDWEPTVEDAFAALTTMIPTMSEYFEQWKLSYFIAGQNSEEQAFVAVSRLFDINGILKGLKLTYDNLSPAVADVDPELDSRINDDFARLISFVDDLYQDEQRGRVFTAEEADQYGTQAQEMAEQLVGMVAQAAELLNVQISE